MDRQNQARRRREEALAIEEEEEALVLAEEEREEKGREADLQAKRLQVSPSLPPSPCL